MSNFVADKKLITYSSILTKVGIVNKDVANIVGISESYLSLILRKQKVCPDCLQELIFIDFLKFIEKENVIIRKICDITPAEHALNKRPIIAKLKQKFYSYIYISKKQ